MTPGGNEPQATAAGCSSGSGDSDSTASVRRPPAHDATRNCGVVPGHLQPSAMPPLQYHSDLNFGDDMLLLESGNAVADAIEQRAALQMQRAIVLQEQLHSHPQQQLRQWQHFEMQQCEPRQQGDLATVSAPGFGASPIALDDDWPPFSAAPLSDIWKSGADTPPPVLTTLDDSPGIFTVTPDPLCARL